MNHKHFPAKQGLYDPQFERDSCGVGFVCNINGQKSHNIIDQGLMILKHLAHRGAVGADPKTGDGAGILIQVPHEFLLKECKENEINLPHVGEYGTGLIFLPQDRKECDYCKNIFSKVISAEGQELLGWRKVPVDDSLIGKMARETEPIIEQIFIRKSENISGQLSFERKLYIIRKQIENEIHSSKLKQKSFFYITNISSRTMSYKGLLMPHQLEDFFLDLKDEAIKSAICLVHSRYSTNTFPTWDLAQPFRFLAHNGEINTLRGNINWMRAREGLLKNKYFGKDIEKIKPVIAPGGSDSATIDNVFELLTLSGRSMQHAMTMLIPSAWGKYTLVDEKLKEFFRYHACLMEPWDGPATIAFTNGKQIGAVLDRNGLRPARYIVTKNDLVVMASEVGVLDLNPNEILYSGRLEPGKMFFIDTELKKIVKDEEIKESLLHERPYCEWTKKHIIELDELPKLKRKKKIENHINNVLLEMKIFGYTREDLTYLLKPMGETGKEPIGSMGNDTPHAILSSKPQLLFNYFKQLFAQVTNPAIDPIREDFVMSIRSFIGPQKNILEEIPDHAMKLDVREPILTNSELDKIRHINGKGFKTKTVSLLFDIRKKGSFMKALDRICKQAEHAIKEKYSFIILSDKGVNENYAALPSLMAMGCVQHHLVQKAMRTQISIIIESAEPREVHHFALLFGYGADCVNPYLAYEALRHLIHLGELNISINEAVRNYRKAINKGILKILSKMGISTIRSYRGAQIFEALGLDNHIIDKCFAGTASRIGGADFEVIQEETIKRHIKAFSDTEKGSSILPTGGIYQWKRDGEFHLWNPESIATLQEATRKGDYAKYKVFSKLIDDQSKHPTTIRSLLEFKKTTPIPIEEVEPVEEIVKRFATGAMSFGSISGAAHRSLAIAMNRLGAKSNTGEGGEDPSRFNPLPNGDSERSAIKQVASGRFGVTTNYLINADELQIKIAQGAKPGEGGQLPGHKVSAIIAKTRYTTPMVTLISPPPHHDIYSIEDLAQLIFDLKNVNPNARISVKLVSEIGVGTIAAGVAKGHADMILISGGDGGTGASPLSSIRHAGLPWELGLSETHQTLVLNNLRSRVRLQTDGQLRTGKDVAIATMLGAEEYGFCTAALIVLGCVMLRHCHLNNCSIGIATQEELLENRFKGNPDHVVNYFNFVATELREIMATLGVRKIEEMVGRTDLLKVNKSIIPWKAKGIDYSRILHKPKVGDNVGCNTRQDHGIDSVLDKKLIHLSKKALTEKEQTKIHMKINNANRSTGAMLSGEICKIHGESGLPPNTIHCKFEGTAGQSFGAFLAKGVTFELEGMSNDYIGKGLFGGKIIVYPTKNSDYKPEENVLIGNTAFYGAINGEAYINGIAGERFCIRNSGLYAVVEGVGDHGCEYMTGGRVLVLGKTGRNFAAGMSGGIAYVYDEDEKFKLRCNTDMVILETPGDEDKNIIKTLLSNHHRYTGSSLAKHFLDNFKSEIRHFVKVIPIEYKRITEGIKVEDRLDLKEYTDG
ncbi:MAG: glutamate synthase large subunit [Methanocellales archaeon]|nr:glutamate synthase large subunit [Methanocellales archaeon]MDD3292056.1 glutamate synthase large subunit [Methanocellales archaeon]MDD5235563.1 glutamate synthase large subunit [Methanocellales archaeon]MDD5485587.1 glutamate synthase large subunit [Methanocellales archaeon]